MLVEIISTFLEPLLIFMVMIIYLGSSGEMIPFLSSEPVENEMQKTQMADQRIRFVTDKSDGRMRF